MSNKKTTPGGFTVAVSDIIQEYSDEVVKAMPDAVKKAAKEGVKALKSAAASAVGGTTYKNSFKSKATQTSSDLTEYTIYSSRYQVAHLLEHGHVVRNKYGVYGVAPAHPHWATAEEKANEILEEEIQKAMEESG